MAKSSSSPKQKILIATALLSFISTPFLVILGTGPFALILPCVKTAVWFSNPARYTCEPSSLLSFAILLSAPVIIGIGLIFIAVSAKK